MSAIVSLLDVATVFSLFNTTILKALCTSIEMFYDGQNCMQPDPWNDGNYSTPQTVLISDGQQFPQGQQYLAGDPQAMRYPILLQPPSSTPKVIGILFILYGLVSGLGVLSPLEPLLAGEGEASALRIPMINAVSSMVSAVTAILGGYWLINYQRRGVQLIILGILMSSALAFLTFFLGEDGGLGELLGDESAAFGILSVTQAIVTVVCGLIAAIPILTSSVGLDRSSLFSGLK
ncbi:hypothetical protein N9L41_00060 [Euryarchaeota archaeon]|nr:hypothetical protein [Euryarchaeota archaeon]